MNKSSSSAKRSCCKSSRRTMSLSLPGILLVLLFFSLILLKSDGQYEEWCVADEQTPDEELQRALDWACGNGADCSKIQVNQPCYLPNTVRDHASVAFNSYYQKLKHKGASCYFNSAAIITSLDPSHGSCKYEFRP
ncbi:Glucan endo-1,3-beta-D-glucosidase [Bertholletia excelsa]